MIGADRARYNGNVAWRAVVPVAALGAHAPPPTDCVRAGAPRHAVTTRLRGGTLANFVGMVEEPEPAPEGWREVARDRDGASFASADGALTLALKTKTRRFLRGAPDAAAARATADLSAAAAPTVVYRSGRDRILHYAPTIDASGAGVRRWSVIGPLTRRRAALHSIGVLEIEFSWVDGAPSDAVAAAAAAFEDEAHAVLLGGLDVDAARDWPRLDEITVETEPLTDFHRLRRRRFFDAVTLAAPARLEVERTSSGRFRLFDRKGGPGAFYLDCDVERLPGGVGTDDARRAARAVIAGALRNARARGGAVMRDDGAGQGRAIEEIDSAFHVRAVWDEQRENGADPHRMFGWCVVKPIKDRLIVASFTLAIPLSRLGQP